jgi:hypothetical protein
MDNKYIKMSLRADLTQVRMVIITNIPNNKSWQGFWQRWWDGQSNIYSLLVVVN